jgi:preprotein translocase subunit SecY
VPVDLSVVLQLAEKLGIGGAVGLIFTAGVAFRLPEILREIRHIIDVIMHRGIERKKINEFIRQNKETAMREIEAMRQKRDGK